MDPVVTLVVSRLDGAGNLLGETTVLEAGGEPAYGWSGRDSLVIGTDAGPTGINDPEPNLELYSTRINCCDDLDGDGFTECSEGNDADPTTYPGAPEVCDTRDNDGDGGIDEETCGVRTCAGPEGCSRGPTDCAGNLVTPNCDIALVADVQHNAPSYPSVVWTGSEYGVFFRGFFRMFDASLQPLHDPVTLTGCGVAPLVWTGSEFGITCSSAGFTRLDRAGKRIATSPVQAYGPMVWTGSEYVVATISQVGNESDDLSFVRIDAAGNQVGLRIRVPVICDKNYCRPLDLAWTGSELALLFLAGSTPAEGNIRLARFGLDGIRHAPVETLDSGQGSGGSLVWTGTEYAAAWSFRESAGEGIRFVRLGSSGTPADPETLVAAGSGYMGATSLVWTGEEYGLVWQDDSFGGYRVFLATIDGSGAVIESGQVSPGLVEDSETPDLVWNGTDYVVVYAHRFFVEPYGEPCGPWETWIQRVSCCGNDRDGDGSTSCQDCDDLDSTVRPGIYENCSNEIDDNCNALVDLEDPRCQPETECFDGIDNEPDGVADCGDTDCAGMIGGGCETGMGGLCEQGSMHCSGGIAVCLPDHDSVEICDGVDNDCDGAVDEDFDLDGDGLAGCGPDCNDTDPSTYPGAPEVNDGHDNQCPGDPGHGQIDEISSVSAWDDRLCWEPQQGAQGYEIKRSTDPTMVSDCVSLVTGQNCYYPWEVPAAGQVMYYLVRPSGPNRGSFGVDSAGNDRPTESCPISAWAHRRPAVDGTIGPDEWADAATLVVDPGCADNPYAVTMMIKNDRTNLYAAIVSGEQIDDGEASFGLVFDHDGSGKSAIGDNASWVSADGTATDEYVSGLSFGIPLTAEDMQNPGGTHDLEAAIGHSAATPTEPGDLVAEFEMPLASGDVAHDLSLVIGNRFGVQFWEVADSTCGLIWPLMAYVLATVAAEPISQDADRTRAVALRDVNGDGSLDLVVGNSGRNRLYLNNGTSQPWDGVNGVDITVDSVDTRTILLGDVDGDGDLDLVAGNTGRNRLYLNNGSSDPWDGVDGIDITHHAADTRAMVLEDVDGDGDLDLITGNHGTTTRLYTNRCSEKGGCNGEEYPWDGVQGANISSDAHDTLSLVLLDVTSDGHRDLIVGNAWGQPMRLYRHDGTPSAFDGAQGENFVTDTLGARSIAIGDVSDAPGDEIVVGVWNRPPRFYFDNGAGDRPVMQVVPDVAPTTSVLLGDWNGDGLEDLVVGNWGAPTRMYLNGRDTQVNGNPWQGVSGFDISAAAYSTSSLAMGDVDGDGDLDLVIGNWNEPNRLFRND